MTDDVKPYTREELDELREQVEGDRPFEPWLHRLLATARAGLGDTARLDWIEARLNAGDLDTYGTYVQAVRRWEMSDGGSFATFREALDAGRVHARSGRRTDSTETTNG